MIKIIIQIPCFNEEFQIKSLIEDLKNSINSFEYDLLIIDDGSIDRTVEIAKELEVDHIISFKRNMGLGYAFQAGLNFAKEKGYDFLINTDADNQYQSKYINDLYKNILETGSDIVIGARNHNKIKHFSLFKKIFQKLGSWVVRIISGEKISDAVSGFRIYSKEAIHSLQVISQFSYTLDTILQAKDKNLKISEIPIEINPPTRPSRLFKGMFQFIKRQLTIIIKCFIIYKPFEFFSLLAVFPFIIGILPISHFIYRYFIGEGTGNIQSITLGSMSMLLSFILIALGVIGFLIKDLRKKNS